MSLEALYRKLKKLFTEGVLKIDTSGSDIATETTLSSVNTSVSSIDGKITKADTDNVKVVSEVAWDSTNDLKKISINADYVGLARDSTIPNTAGQMINSLLNDVRGAWRLGILDLTLSQTDPMLSIPSGTEFSVGNLTLANKIDVRGELRCYGNVLLEPNGLIRIGESGKLVLTKL